MVKVFCDEKHLLIFILCISDFHKSLRLMAESMSSESESDILIYENIVEIKQKKEEKWDTWRNDTQQCKCRRTSQIS